MNVYHVFVEVFEDSSVYFAAKKNWPENASKSLSWAKSVKEEFPHSERPLVEKYLEFKGVSKRINLASELSKKEAGLLKNNLIRKYFNSKCLNVQMKTFVELSTMNKQEITKLLEGDVLRAEQLIEIFDYIASEYELLAFESMSSIL